MTHALSTVSHMLSPADSRRHAVLRCLWQAGDLHIQQPKVFFSYCRRVSQFMLY